MTQEPSDKLRVEFVKSNLFRVIHIDGAYGGITPRLSLFINLYSERFPIPKVLTYRLSPQGAPEKEILEERESKEGVIRECEVGLVLDLPAAKSLLEWLQGKVVELQNIREEVRVSKESSK